MTTVALGPLTPVDVHPLARLHRAAFPGYFLSTLGEDFLVEFYRAFLTDDTAVTVVARSPNGSVQGAVVGTTEPAGFFGRLARSRWPRFFLASLKTVARNPKATPRLLRAVRYRGDMPAGARGALLSSIFVQPSVQGAGVGRQLVEAWTREVLSRGVRRAYLSTDADDNDAVNRFYEVQGWVVSERYMTHEGRSMNLYTKRLDER